jgi:hypothetical protein
MLPYAACGALPLLALCALKRSDSDDIAIPNVTHVLSMKRHKGLCSPRPSNKLDFHRVRSQQFNDRTEVAAAQANSGHVMRDGNGI